MLLKNLSLILNIPLLLIGFFLLNRGGGMLVDGSTSIARKLKLPESMISFTVVALGTSLPKFFTVLLSVYNGYFDLAIGAVLGSCIFNLLGVLSIAGLTRPIRSNKNTATIGVLSLILSALLLYVVANYSIFREPTPTTFFITHTEAFLLITGFVLFMTYAYFNIKKQNTIWFTATEEPQSFYPLGFAIPLVCIGILGLIAGGVLVVDNLVDISRKYQLSQRFLGQFVLSFGGSIIVVYWTLKTKSNQTKFELSNLLGKNILNILAMIGIAAFIQPIQYNSSFNLDILILIAISTLIMAMLWMGKKLTLNLSKCRLLLLLLFIYIIYLFVR